MPVLSDLPKVHVVHELLSFELNLKTIIGLAPVMLVVRTWFRADAVVVKTRRNLH